MLRVVVLGTGTGVGKTRFSRLLVRALRSLTQDDVIGAVKPVETGHGRGPGGAPAAGSDAAQLEAESASSPPRPHPLIALPTPLSAHLAARRARVRVSVESLAEWVLALPYTICIAETAGGIFSPLTDDVTNADLARKLDPALWIVVAPDSLGVLHDVRAAWLALKAMRRAPDFLVLSAARRPDASTGTNARELARLGLPAPIAVLPRGTQSHRALIPLASAILARADVSRGTKAARQTVEAARRRPARKTRVNGSRRR